VILTRSRVAALIVLVPLGLAGCGGSPVKAGPTASTAPPASADVEPNAAPSTAPPPSATASAPEPGSTLASSTQDGAIFAVANAAGQGFTIGDDVISGNDEQSTLQTYDVSGTSLVQLSSGFSAGCGLADVTNSKGRLVVAENIAEKPAEGINPALYSLSITAFDAGTGTAVWSDKVITDTQESLGCPAGGVDDLVGFAATSDGHYGVLLWPWQNSTLALAIDLTDGSVHRRQDLVGVLGKYLLRGSDRARDDNGHANTLTLTTPDGWPSLGHTPAADANEIQSTATGWLDNQAGSGDQKGVGVTPDGIRLISADQTVSSDYTEHNYVDGYLLPGMTRAWRYTSPPGTNDQVLDVTDDLVLVNRADDNRDNHLIGLDAVTGKQLWNTDIHDGTVCLSTEARVLVDANEQLATLDATTGKQLGYNDNIKHALLGDEDAGCPKVLGNGLEGIGSRVDGSELTVAQLVTP